MATPKVNPNVRASDAEQMARTVKQLCTPLAGRFEIADAITRDAVLPAITGTAATDIANMHKAMAWIVDRMIEKGWA